MNRDKEVTICVFMKPARPGEVKTRLGPAVGLQGAAALAQAFFDDIWETVSSLDWAFRVVACTDAIDFQDGREVWTQGEGDLGWKQEHILRRALRKSPLALVVGSDLPGLPSRLLESARLALLKADAVLGPSEDGGFYLIGLKHCPYGLLSGIPWSQPDTFSQTLSRFRSNDMNVSILESWFDVDTPEDFSRLQSLMQAGAIVAPHTSAILRYSGKVPRRSRQEISAHKANSFADGTAENALQPHKPQPIEQQLFVATTKCRRSGGL